jgi:hypothetical protein
MHRYSIKPEQIETIKAVRFDTCWTPAISTKIITDPDEAIELISNDNPDMKVFTDSSGMERCIGASTVLYWNRRLKTTL